MLKDETILVGAPRGLRMSLKMSFMFPAADLIENTQIYYVYSALLSVYTVTRSIIPMCKCSAIAFDEIRNPIYLLAYLITYLLTYSMQQSPS
jgi:hypothetical protein